MRPWKSSVTPLGLLLTIDIDSEASVDVKFTVAVTVTVSPGAAVGELALNDIVVEALLRIAFDGPDARTPNPNAATKASATRLNDIDLLVICFLS